ncbi:MAG: hypothetical protein QW057_06520 [Candidatus Bathyarchaeia archaeon]
MSVESLRHVFLTLGMILGLFSTTLLSSPQRAEGIPYFNVEVQAYDALTIYIEPAVEGLTAQCDPLGGKQPFILYVASNSSARSVVQLYTEAESSYNITLSFESSETWRLRVGVITSNPKPYGSPVVESRGTGYFVELSGLRESPGSQVINILAHARGLQKEKGLVSIQLPSAFNFLLVLLLALPLAYGNLFAVTDTYFRNKSEGVSRRRRIGVALLLLSSMMLVYWAYSWAVASELPAPGGETG